MEYLHAMLMMIEVLVAHILLSVMIVLQRPSLEYGIWQMEGPDYLTYLFEILRLQNVSAALDVKDHLVEPDLGRVRVPQVLVVVDEL